jgi:hypothetical protein
VDNSGLSGLVSVVGVFPVLGNDAGCFFEL